MFNSQLTHLLTSNLSPHEPDWQRGEIHVQRIRPSDMFSGPEYYNDRRRGATEICHTVRPICSCSAGLVLIFMK